MQYLNSHKYSNCFLHFICKFFGFHLQSYTHIINGHVPIHHMEGESPIKCNGKEIREHIKDLKELIQAYRNGAIRQNQRG